MAEYIEREALMKFPIRRDHYDRKNGNEHFINGIESVLDYAENLPSADVAPVRHGRWICIRKGYGEYECSVCHGEDSDCSDYYGTHVVTEQDFCPNCGAKMDLEVSNGKSETVRYAPQGDSE